MQTVDPLDEDWGADSPEPAEAVPEVSANLSVATAD